MFKSLYNDIVHSYTRYIYKEYGQCPNYDSIYIIGLKTVTHVFKFAIINNIDNDTISKYCIKSYYYYCEFISQIQNNNNIYSLPSNAASLFVFKKFLNSSFPKKRTPGVAIIFRDIRQYSETVILLIEHYKCLIEDDINMMTTLNPILKLLSTITHFDDVNQCIIVIKSRSDNSIMFIKVLTKVLLFIKKHGRIHNIFRMSTNSLTQFKYLLE